MIVKQIESQSRESNYFQALISYLLNPQGKEHRVGTARLSNYDSEDVKGARFETAVLQKQNTRAKSSDTMHLVVSFPAGEVPSKEVLEKIEDRLAKSLGMEMHQRISVTHHDTDHFHLHIAINKVHPVSHNLISPAFSWTALAKCALQCEQDFKLTHDNHVVQRVLFVDGKPVIENYEPGDDYIRNQKARDMEFKEGIESVTRFLKNEMLEPLSGAKTWQEFNSLLKDKGLTLQIKGNGFVFKTDDDSVSVKASPVSREFSFEKLSKKLGPFEPFDPEPKDESKWKRKGPSALYLRYLEERNTAWLAKKMGAKDEAFRAREEAKSRYRAALASIRTKRDKQARDLFRAKAFEIYQKELDAINERQKKTFERFKQEKPLGWKAWVQRRAMEGDIEALLELRKKDLRLRKALTLRSNEPSKLLLDSIERDSVTKAGTVIYRCGETTLRDSGQDLIVSQDYERDALTAALTAAKEKFGDSPLIINGSDEFKNDLLIVAASVNLDLKFQDAKLQESYEKLKEKEREQRRIGRRFGRTGRPVNGSNGTRRGTGARVARSDGSEFANQLYADLPEDLAKLPAESIARVLLSQSTEEVSGDSMFEMPERSVGGEGEHSNVQMPSLVRGDVPGAETEQHSGVRHLSKSDERERIRRRTSVETYVEERNRKREFIETILEHKPYSSESGDSFIFKGLRHVDGVALILLQHGKTVYVKDIPNSQVKFIRTLAVNSNVRVEGEHITLMQQRKIK